MTDIQVKNEEMRTTREVTRELGAILRQLEVGKVNKIVVMNRNAMAGVILSVEEYARLQEVSGT